MTIDRITSELAGRYQGALSAMTGILARALDSHDPTSPRSRDEVRRLLDAEVGRFVDTLPALVYGYAEALMLKHTDALSSPDIETLRGHVYEHADDLVASLTLCITRDAMTVAASLRKLALKVDLASSGGMSRVGALIKHKFGILRGLGFSQMDRAGRRSNSLRFATLIIRQHLLLIEIESELFAMSKQGIDIVEIERDGLILAKFSITGSSNDLPSYEDVGRQVIHPNFTGKLIGVI